MKINKKVIVNILMIVIAFVLIYTQIYFEKNSDLVGFSIIEIRIIKIAEVITYIIIPLVLVVTVALKKDYMNILLLMLRSFIFCILLVINAIENIGISRGSAGVLVLNMIYIVILSCLCSKVISHKILIGLVIICRIMSMFFSGNLFGLLCALENGNTSLLLNILSLLASELLFILPLIYYDGAKLKKEKQAV